MARKDIENTTSTSELQATQHNTKSWKDYRVAALPRCYLQAHKEQKADLE